MLNQTRCNELCLPLRYDVDGCVDVEIENVATENGASLIQPKTINETQTIMLHY